MKKLFIFLFVPLVVISCRDKSISTTPEVILDFDCFVKNEKIKIGDGKYYISGNNEYSIETLKYYLSNARLVNNKGKKITVKLDTFRLIDHSTVAGEILRMGKLPNDTYTSLEFDFGIPYERNHGGAQIGDLDPMLGMIWEWITGYIFQRQEGKIKDENGNIKGMSHHLATDSAFFTISIPLNNFVLNGKNATIHLAYDIDKYINSQDLKNHPIVHSGVNDNLWIKNMKNEISKSFSISSIEYAQ